MVSRIASKQTRTVAASLAVMAAVCSSVSEAKALEQMERYYVTCWRNAGIPDQEWNDCTQEAMLDLLQRIPRTQLSQAIYSPKSEQRRELNRSVWCIVQRWRRAPRYQSLEGDFSDKQVDSLSAWLDHQVIQDLVHSQESPLSQQQRSILSHYLDGHSVADISKELGMPASRVSDQKYKAIQKLRENYAQHA